MTARLLTVTAAALAAGATALTTGLTAGAAAAPDGHRASAAVPVTGGTLNVLTTSDVDYLDPNLTYYTVGAAAARLYSRQLYTYPAEQEAESVVPDLATGAPQVSNGGRTFRITIREGAQWDTPTPRRVTAADEVRGVEMTCNPFQPFGGLSDFEALLAGMKSFCSGFERATPTTAGIKRYLASHRISGLSANGQTVTFRLTHPVAYLEQLLGMPAMSPRPVEALNYLPGSAADFQHTISDGPYRVKTYRPTRSITFVRNPAWNPATDQVRHAYVDTIKWNESAFGDEAVFQMRSGSTSADACICDMSPQAYKSLAGDPDRGLASQGSTNPYLVMNTVSPSSRGALRKTAVRQAVFFALNRSGIIRSFGTRSYDPALTQILPKGIVGYRAGYKPYAHSLSKARRLLHRAHVKTLTIKFLYRADSSSETATFQTVRRQLKAIGVRVRGVHVSDADFYIAYLLNPVSTRHGRWDMASVGWGPDWYDDSAISYFRPLFDGRYLPPGSSNYGLLRDRTLERDIDRADRAATRSAAGRLWFATDRRLMNDAAAYPITEPNVGTYHASQTHGFVYLPYIDSGDETNMWLDAGKQGG